MLKRVSLILSDLLLVVIGAYSIVIAVRSMVEPPTTLAGLAGVLAALLSAIGLLLIAAALERRLRLDTLARRFDALAKAVAPTAIYLSDRHGVIRALTEAVNASRDRILAMGARSSAVDYLRAIEDAVIRREVAYHRVVNGDYIFHAFHEHLIKMLPRENVFVAWTPFEKFGNITVADTDCVIAFPSPYIDRFSGLRLVGESVASQYAQQVMAVYATCQPLTLDTAATMCVDCSKRPEEAATLQPSSR